MYSTIEAAKKEVNFSKVVHDLSFALCVAKTMQLLLNLSAIYAFIYISIATFWNKTAECLAQQLQIERPGQVNSKWHTYTYKKILSFLIFLFE